MVGGICTVIRAPLWRCLSIWWHCDSLKALQALFSKDRGCDLLSGWRRAEPSPSPERQEQKVSKRGSIRCESGRQLCLELGVAAMEKHAYSTRLHIHSAHCLGIPKPKWGTLLEIISQVENRGLWESEPSLLGATQLVPCKARVQMHSPRFLTSSQVPAW